MSSFFVCRRPSAILGDTHVADVTDLPAVALAAAIRAKTCSAAEVVGAYLRRIGTVNPAINAVVQLAGEQAVAQARAADAALARGEALGPLHGVPFTVKDVLETAGVVSAAGLTARAAYVPARDAVVVARLRAAGAILLGKTNCPPGGGGGETTNPVYGQTRNPYDLTRTPGGSSGGEAAIVAAGASPLGIGSDSGGSLRLPAHFCGVTCLKPTSGRVPNTGTLNHPGGLSDPRSQIGPLSRFAQDLLPTLAVIAGVDWRDSGVVPMPLWASGTAQAIDVRGLRLAFYTDDGTASPTPETANAVRQAAASLAAAGMVTDETRPGCLGDARPITESYWHRAGLSGEAIERSLLAWDAFRTAMLAFMEHYDVVLCPTDHTPAPLCGAGDALQFNYTLPYSLTGWPCAVVRAGTSPQGLPIGVQVVARPWREDICVAVAQHIEATGGGWQAPLL
jgi:amidase